MVELSRDLLLSLYPELKDIDPDANVYRIGVTALSCLVSLGIFVLSYIFSRPLEGFQRLSPSQKVFWAATVVRGLFGFNSIVFGLWYLLFDDNLHIDIITESDVTSHFLCYVNLGFFIFEFSCLILSNLFFRHFDIPLFTHHFLGFLMFFFIVYYDVGHYVAIVGALLEMTTPFSCICWLLLKLGKQHTKVWSVNQIILIHLFHCRSILELFWWWQTFKHWNSIVTHFPLVLIVDVYIGLVATTLFLTPYWTMKKTEQYFKRADWNHPGNKASPPEVQANGHRENEIPSSNGFVQHATNLTHTETGSSSRTKGRKRGKKRS